METLGQYIHFQEKIGDGSFGEVFLVETLKGEKRAIKVEKKGKRSRVQSEYQMYKILKDVDGIPKVYDFIQTTEFNLMSMEMLGLNLEEIFVKHDRRFMIPSILYLGREIIKIIQSVHQNGIIHRDIKPHNFLVARKKKTKIMLTDFGLSRKYILDNGLHIPFRKRNSLVGTARYASINLHNGNEASRRDDLESIGYMLIYFMKGRLPWQGVKINEDDPFLTSIGDAKTKYVPNLCDSLPSCFKCYIAYCRSLKFDDEPNYDYLSYLFTSELSYYRFKRPNWSSK
jgi:serine/threonine protein kinase